MKFFGSLKNCFLPHTGNNHKPLLFCEEGVAVVLMVILFVTAFSFSGKVAFDGKVLPASIQSLMLVDLANEDRAENALPELSINPLLVEAAQLKADDMAAKSYFAHTSPEGLTPWHWFTVVGYPFLYAGENLAVNYSESIDVDRAWMNSPLHRANILNGNFTEIGIATSEGIYNGKKTTFVVQMFGSPKAISTPISTQIVTAAPVPTVEPANVVATVEPVASVDVLGETTAEPENVDVIYETDTYMSVKNIEPMKDTATSAKDEVNVVEVVTPEPTTKHTALYERVIANSGHYSRIILFGMLGLVVLSLFFMIVIEIKKQHYKNILYGALIILLLVAILTLGNILFQSPIVI